MHPNPIFRQSPQERNIAFARDRSFGILAVSGADGPLLSHIPFLLNDTATQAELHLVRSNPIIRGLDGPVPARIAVSGPDSYISPDWYGIDHQVPTWNYVAVHLIGQLRPAPEIDFHDLLDRQSALFEERLAPKRPWTSAKMTDGVMEKMMRAIVPCVFEIDRIDGTWKLNQNKPEAARSGAADHVGDAGLGMETAALSDLMRDP